MLKDKVIVVTGGSDGIGKALVSQLLQEDARVATCGRSQEKLNALITSHNNQHLLALPCDVSDEGEAREFIEKTIAHYGKIDILINNAGISMRSPFNEVSLETMRKVMAINFFGAINCTRYAIQSIIDNQGSIVGISSIAGNRGLPGRSGYSASKFALQGWMEALRSELLDTGVNVLWVSPGFTKSNVRKAALTKTTSAQGKSPLNEDKLMTPEECAALIIRAIKKRKRTLVMTAQGKLTVFMNKFFPAWSDRLTRNFFYKNGVLIK
ncbi:MAG: SDR family oxidoreductase [Chitinophagaceae bacterium]|nr:SDR family oxidoreductase [Chitinophagaceae bacterium]MCO5285551.1 SDR family oxidoreductase [Chitinophagaceae bacterium]MCZ2395672.1 SDR family oxidoreductase [Chitinophagales bacterium]